MKSTHGWWAITVRLQTGMKGNNNNSRIGKTSPLRVRLKKNVLSGECKLKVTPKEPKMENKLLSKNFLLSEMLVSRVASQKGTNGKLVYSDIYYALKNPPVEIVDNLQCMCVDFAQPVRDKYTFTMIINSGYRPEELNELIGGSKNSHHCRGMAFDVSSVNNAVLFDLVVNNFQFTQAIWYYDNQSIPDFLHLSYDPYNLKSQILVCKLVANKNGVMRRTYQEVGKDYARQKNR